MKVCEMGVLFANINPDASLGFTRWALHMSAMLWRHFSSLSEFSFNLILLFFFPPTDFPAKSKVNASKGVLMGFIGSKAPLIRKRNRTEMYSVH